ncbi:MAG: FAD-dependent oxidoreductase [bacterium]
MAKIYHSIDIIGGGIIGTTLATELLREIRKQRLNTEVHLFERRGQLGMENTEKSFEGVRTYWFTSEEIRFYLTSIRAFQNLEDHFGDDGRFKKEDTDAVRLTASYKPVGYHYFYSEKDFTQAQKLKSLFDAEGVPLECYTKDEAMQIEWIANNFNLDARVLDEDGWVTQNFDLEGWSGKGFDLEAILPNENRKQYAIAGYVHVPVAGFVSAGDVISSYRAVFKKLGGKLHLNTEVVSADTQGESVKNIRYRFVNESGRKGTSNAGRIHKKPTDYIVNAAGVWSDELNQKILGERLGITPHKRYPLIVKPPQAYRTDHGMVMLRERVIRPDGDKIWLYYTPPKEKPGIEDNQPTDRVFDEYFFEYIFPVFCHPEKSFIRRAETLGLYGSTDRRGWLGHYADTPDEKPLIGVPRPEKLKNYSVSTGYSGHGVQASVAAALGLEHKILRLKTEPIVEIPEIYAADRDLSHTAADHSRL